MAAEMRIFAELDLSLPSIEQIKASTNFVSRPDTSTKVVQMSEDKVVKFGVTVSLEEAETLAYIAASSDVSVSKVFASFSEPDTDINFIVMNTLLGNLSIKFYQA